MPCFKIMSILAGVAALTAAVPASAADGPAKSVCLSTQSIDHTDTPDDYTLIFHMRNHKMWKAALTDRCVGLKNNMHGFTYAPSTPSNQICSNLLTIRVNDTGTICIVGEITPVAPIATTQ